MREKIFFAFSLASLLFSSPASIAETLEEYVAACKAELGFTQAEDFNCNDGERFYGGPNFNGPQNDFVGHRAVNSNVDAIFACRWGYPKYDSDPITSAKTVELLLHNRKNGKTCFFASRNDAPAGVVNIISPTKPEASTYWQQPTQVDANFQCAGCHVAGPYIASVHIADKLAKFGLLNDGHDTIVIGNNGQPVANAYQVVGQTFNHWNNLIRNQFLTRHDMTCAESCHAIAYGSNAPGIYDYYGDVRHYVVQSISSVISSLENNGEMPPREFESAYGKSSYRWINLGTPDGSGERESFVEAKLKFPELLSYCDEPGAVEARAVGSDFIFSSNPFPDVLSRFNLRDGLTCLNNQQPSGKCNNYQTRYLCDGQWTAWLNRDTPNATGDHEGRESLNPCNNPTAIEAKTTVNSVTYRAYGPNDRLASFDKNGLACRNEDQRAGGTCFNYVVHYKNCATLPTVTKRLRNVWSGRFVTATNTGNDSETRAQPLNTSWSSQHWAIEPYAGRHYVRLRNLWSGTYLNAQSDTDNAMAVVYALNDSWTSQHWIIEPVNGTDQIRLKNAWTNRYLTVADSGNYSPILLQNLNPGWTSQIWIMDNN